MKDWIGLWFEIQAARGHSDEAPLLLVHLPKTKIENFSFLHRKMDGVVALNAALRAKGLERANVGQRKMARPSWHLIPRLLARGLVGNNEGGRPNWKFFRPERQEKPKWIGFLHLDESADSALLLFLRQNRVSLSAYLLSLLPQAMANELCEGLPEGSWQLPVDMRPAFPERPLGGNCVSYIKIPSAADAPQIHQRIKMALQAAEHWSNWWVYHIGKLVGYRGMQRLSRRSSERTFWLGSFTDLGDWTPTTNREDFCSSVWAITAPGTPNNPASCATIAWFGQRSISLRIHPAISENSPESARIILNRLAEAIERDTGASTKLVEIELPPV